MTSLRTFYASCVPQSTTLNRLQFLWAGRRCSSSSSSTSSVVAAKKRGTVLRSFQAEKLLQGVSSNDIVLAKQEQAALFSFLCFLGDSPAQVAAKLLALPAEQRHVHTMFGRGGSRCDLALDLDFPLCTASPSSKDFYTGESVLLDTLKAIDTYFPSQLKIKPPTDVLVLDGGSTKKHSYHVHLRHSEAVCGDYNTMLHIASGINATLPVTPIDVGVYRAKGMLRCAFTPKFNERSRALLPMTNVKDAELARLLRPMHDLPDAEIMARSFITRADATPDTPLIKTSKGKGTTIYTADGFFIPPYLSEDKKWVRFSEAVRAIDRLPLVACENYELWIRVGLSLHSFGNDRHIKDKWVAMSMRARHKFKKEDLDYQWKWFSKRPDCFNWRRGYHYLTRTIRRDMRSL